jgi:hypothetical protein
VGIDPSSVGVSADASGDILLNLGNGDLVTLQNALNSADGTTYGVQQISFADGAIWSYSDLVGLAETGSATNTRLYGGAGAETFDSKGIATYEQGGGGGDTFIYDRGYSALTINEQDQGDNPNNVLAFGAGISASDVQVSADAKGDIILDLGDGDRITLTNSLSDDSFNVYSAGVPGVQQVNFADGTTWSAADLLQFADIGSSANTSLFGDANANVFDSRGYATYEQGGGGGGTFIYNSGYGALTINEIDGANAYDNVLTFGAGIDPGDVGIATDAEGDIILSLGGSDAITLKGMAASAHAGVQSVHFADGTVWDAAQIIASANGGTLTVDPTAATSAIGSTYYSTGSYGVRDIDASATAPQSVETVAINGSSYYYSVSAIDGSNDILITDYQGEGVRLVGALADGGANVPSISFADGTTWTYAQLAEKLQTPGSSSAPGLFGDSQANTLDTQGMTSFAQGGGGGDTFVYNTGYGALEIREADASASPANILSFGSGIDPADVSVSADTNGDIILTLSGGSDQVTLDNALNSVSGASYGVQQIMDIGACSEPARDGPLVISDRKCATQGPAILALRVAQAVFDLVRFAGLKRVAPNRPGAFLVLGMEHAVPAPAIGRAFRNAGIFVPAGIIIIVKAVRTRRPDHLGHGVRQNPETGFLFVALTTAAVRRAAQREQCYDRLGEDQKPLLLDGR